MKSITNRIISIALALMLALGACAFAENPPDAASIADQVVDTVTDETQIATPFTSIISQVQNSVVGVNNYQMFTYTNFSSYYGFGGFGGFDGFGGFGGDRGSPSRETVERLVATGSGVVVYDNLIITNYHVVEDATRLTISTLESDEEYESELIAYDEAADIALVYVKKLDIEPVPLGDSDKLQVGEWAICIGNPLSEELRGTVTLGIISALDRKIDSTSTTDRYGLKTTYTNSMIQTNAAINSGNSGGGLFNVLGQLQGIPSMKYTGSYYSGTMIEGIGLAIPINTAKPVIREAIVKLLTGETLTKSEGDKKANADDAPVIVGDGPILGVSIAAINANNHYAVYMGVLPAGVKVNEVYADSPAEKAGILQNDIIVEADGTIITSTTHLRDALSKKQFGDTLNIKVYRAEGLADAQYVTDIGKGEYVDISVELFAYSTPTN